MRQLKAEFYKLKYSKSTVWIAAYMIAMFLVPFIVGNDTLFMTFGDYKNIDSIGWICYIADVNNPQFAEIARFTMANNFFIWIGFVVYITVMVSSEYQLGTLKLPVIYGCNKTRLFVDKLIVLNVYFFILYFVMESLLGLALGLKYGLSYSVSEYLSLLGIILLNVFVMIGLEMFTFVLTILLKNPGIVSALSCVWFFAGAITYPMVYENLEYQSLGIRVFCALNPTTYMYNICGYRITQDLIIGTIVFGVGACLVGILAMHFILKRQEF